MSHSVGDGTVKNKRIGPVTQLVARVEELEQLAQELKNEYLRALADFDNYRRRNERDLEIRQRERLDALMSEILPVLDNFERAMGTGTDNADALKRGVELIHRQLCDVLVSYGLKPFSCLGEEFDPRRAEAVGFVECEHDNVNRVVEELGKGYECSGRVLRPARVKVGKVADSGTESPNEEVKEIGAEEDESNS